MNLTCRKRPSVEDGISILECSCRFHGWVNMKWIQLHELLSVKRRVYEQGQIYYSKR